MFTVCASVHILTSLALQEIGTWRDCLEQVQKRKGYTSGFALLLVCQRRGLGGFWSPNSRFSSLLRDETPSRQYCLRLGQGFLLWRRKRSWLNTTSRRSKSTQIATTWPNFSTSSYSTYIASMLASRSTPSFGKKNEKSLKNLFTKNLQTQKQLCGGQVSRATSSWERRTENKLNFTL